MNQPAILQQDQLTTQLTTQPMISAPELYIPMLEDGVMKDLIPSNALKFTNKYPNGLECCNGNVFTSRTSFINHSKTKGHIKWLRELESENKNSYGRVISLEKLVKNQQMIITKLSNQISQLTAAKQVPCADLLMFE
jgi:hypothetical protein